MRLVGCFLLLSGWLIVVSAVAMLAALDKRMAFVAAGFAVEVLGLGLLIQGYRTAQRNEG